MLGHDGDLLAGVVRLRLLQSDLDGAVVGGLDLAEVLDEAAVGHRHLFLLHHLVVGPGDVLRGQRFTIGPLHVRTDRVGPDLALGVRVPFGGEPLGDRTVLGVVGHKILVHIPEGVRRHEVERRERVEGVDETVGGDPQHVLGGRSLRGGGLCRGGGHRSGKSQCCDAGQASAQAHAHGAAQRVLSDHWTPSVPAAGGGSCLRRLDRGHEFSACDRRNVLSVTLCRNGCETAAPAHNFWRVALCDPHNRNMLAHDGQAHAGDSDHMTTVREPCTRHGSRTDEGIRPWPRPSGRRSRWWSWPSAAAG